MKELLKGILNTRKRNIKMGKMARTPRVAYSTQALGQTAMDDIFTVWKGKEVTTKNLVASQAIPQK